MKVNLNSPSCGSERVKFFNNAVINSAGGISYRSSNPIQRLIESIGVPNFNEPTYYGGSGKSIINSRDDLTPVAQNIIADAEELAQSKNAHMLLSLAWWARDAARVRTTPVVLLAVASHYRKSSRFVRKYASKIITRPDQIKDLWTIYDLLYCRSKRKFPPCLKRATNDILGSFNEVQILKYNNNNRFPRFRDILKMTNYGIDVVKRRRDGKKIRIRKVSTAIKDYLVYGKISNPAEIPVISARVNFNKSKYFDDITKQNAIASCANWEVVVSKFGNNRKTWEFLIENNLIGYMAMLRNLRNILNARVSDKHIEIVSKFLVDKATKNKQMPITLYSAQCAVENGFGYGKSMKTEYNPVQQSVHRIQKALDDALTKIIRSIPKISGTSAILVDASGSMQTPLSGMSEVRCIDVAAFLASIARSISSENSIIVAFGTKAQIVNYNPNDSTATITKTILSSDVGHSTCAYKAIELLIDKQIVADRIIILSDMETYGDTKTSNEHSVASMFLKYRTKINPKCNLYAIDLCGSSNGSSVVNDEVDGVFRLSGHSENVFRTAILAESNNFSIDQASIIEVIKKQYTLNAFGQAKVKQDGWKNEN